MTASNTPPAATPPNSTHPAHPRGAREGEHYTIRRKMLRLLGAGFTIYDNAGGIAGYCDQKGFRLREDIRIYADETKRAELFRLRTRAIIDFGATYEVVIADEVIGSLRRKGLKSSFVRDEWLIFDGAGREAAMIQEKNATLAMARRLSDAFSMVPQTFQVFRSGDGALLATFRQHFNPFIYRLGVLIEDEPDDTVDDLVLLAAACLIAAIEGRQG